MHKKLSDTLTNLGKIIKTFQKKGCSESEKVNLLDAFYYLSCVVRGGRVTTKYYKP